MFVKAATSELNIDMSISWPHEVKFDYGEKDGQVTVRFFDGAELLLNDLVKVLPTASFKNENDTTILSLPKTSLVSAKKLENIIHIKLKKPTKSTSVAKKMSSSSIDLEKLKQKISQHFKIARPTSQSKLWFDANSDIQLAYPEAPIAVYVHNEKINVVVKSTNPPQLSSEDLKSFAANLITTPDGFLITTPLKDGHTPLVKKSAVGWHIYQGEHLPLGKTPLFLEEVDDDLLQLSANNLSTPVSIGGIRVFCTQSLDTFVPFELKIDKSLLMSTTMGVAVVEPKEEALIIKSTLISWDTTGGHKALQDQEKSKTLQLFKKVNNQTHFLEQEQALLKEVSESDNDEITKKKLDLALFYIANLFQHEAADVLEELAEDYPNFESNTLILLRSMILSTGGNYSELPPLLKDLFLSSKTSPEMAAWYSLLRSQYYSDSIPSHLLLTLKKSISTLPHPLQTQLYFNLADSCVRQEEKISHEVVSLIQPYHLTQRQKQLYNFFELIGAEITGEPVNKAELMKLFESTTDAWLMTRILIHPAFLGAKKQLDDKYILLLESLVPQLRGSWLQHVAIEYLLNIYTQKKDYLKVLDQAVALKKNNPSSYQKLRSNIENIVNGIIRHKLHNKLGVVQTLRLLSEFFDLIDSNEDSLDFLMEFLHKLSHIGLEKESAHLLENFTKKADLNLSTKKQFDVYLQLLALYIKDHATNKAHQLINVLEAFQNIPSKKEARFTFLKAKLDVLEGKVDKAIQRLNTIDSREGVMLQIDLLWRKKEWTQVIEKIRHSSLLEEGVLEPERLERYVIQLATAIVLNAQENGFVTDDRKRVTTELQELYQNYELMLDKYKKLFHLFISQPLNSSATEMTLTLIDDEMKETERLDGLFKETTNVETH